MSTSMIHDPVARLQAAAQDPTALAAVAEAYQVTLVAWLERVLRDRDLAEEAVQETWLMLGHGRWRFAARSEDAAGDVRAWLRQVALRAALRLRERQQARHRAVSGWMRRRPVEAERPTPLERLVEADRDAVLWAAVAALPHPQRSALDLRFRAGLDFAAIARAQGCTALTARVRTWRVLASLRRKLLLLGFVLLQPGLLAGLAAIEDGDQVVPAGADDGPTAHVLRTRSLATAASVAGMASLFLVAARVWQTAAGEAAVPAASVTHLDRAAVTSQPISASSLTPWQLQRASVVSPSPSFTPATDTEEHPLVLVEMTVLVPDPAAGSPHYDRPALLSARQRVEVLAAAKEVLSQPRLLLASGQAGMVSFGDRRAYVAGYRRTPTGWQAVEETIEDGVASTVRIEATPEGACVRELLARRSHLIEVNERQAQVDALDLRWEEPRVLESRTPPPPVEGWFIPTGSSLLVPVTSGSREERRSVGIVREADPGFTTWWLVLTSTVQTVDDHAPALPKARG